jgi:hypothetical protein
MKFLQLRNHYTKNDTLSTVLLNGLPFGFCLEDPVRFTPKEYGVTAIPAGLYELKVSRSPRFKRDMVQVMRVPGFSGVRIHGGNTAKHTLGCPLWAANQYPGKESSKIQGSLEKVVTAKVKEAAARGEKAWLEIINTREI